MTPQDPTLLEVADLDVSYTVDGRPLPVLRDVNFEVARAEIVGVVGESGCGKSTLGSTLMGQLPPNFKGEDISRRTRKELRRLRGAEMAMIFQDPLTSLNPTFTIGDQMRSAAEAHHARRGRRARADLRRVAIEALAEMGVSDAEHRLRQYPHELSGGLRQRVMIAIALMLRSDLLIADEPTSALDVTLQAQIISLLSRLRRDHGTSIVFISHDLGLVSRLCDRILVMYLGEVIESGPTAEVLHAPRHPYTRALLAAAPSAARRGQRLASIPGRVPSLSQLPVGCTFVDRCDASHEMCVVKAPRPLPLTSGGQVRCHARDDASGYDQSPPRAREPEEVLG
jgi:oligopeptide/dipeptide ABC transporter ATP-binding protein